jgi:hypothetical protein
MLLIIGMLVAIAGFARPSNAGLADLTAPQFAVAQSATSAVIAAHAEDDDCVGECLFCSHPNSCGHCGSASMVLAATVPLGDLPESRTLISPNDTSRALARASGPYRPPRA